MVTTYEKAFLREPRANLECSIFLSLLNIVLFLLQDDFLDCFGDPAVTGKNGTDIQDGKCTWLAVVALQRANPAQRQIMEDHYGSSKLEDVTIIKELYEELQLPHTYSVYEETTYDLIRTQIQQVTRGLPHDLFFKVLDTIFRRNMDA